MPGIQTLRAPAFAPDSTLGGGGGRQNIQQPFVCPLLGDGVDIILPLGPHHADRGIHQIADHRFRVPSHVTHLGELRGFDLDERRACEPSQPARDLGLPHPGGADEDDVVGVISSRMDSGVWDRRQRFRMAIATARLAACCPTM